MAEAYPDDDHHATRPPSLRANRSSIESLDVAIDVASLRPGSVSSPPPPDPPRGTLEAALDHIERDDAPRWLVVKDGVDHGPFSGRDVVERVARGEVLGEHVLFNLDTRSRSKVESTRGFAEFAAHFQARAAEAAQQTAVASARRAEKRTGLAKGAAGAIVLLALVAAGAVFLLTRADDTATRQAPAASGERYRPGQISIHGTADLLYAPARRARRGRRDTTHDAPSRTTETAGSYEAAMNQPVDLGDVTRGGGERRLTGAEVAATVNQGIDAIYRRCVTPSVRADGPFTASVDLAIAGSGAVLGASVRAGPDGFRRCVSDAMTALRFPAFSAPRMGARYRFEVQ